MRYITYLREHAGWLVIFGIMLLTIETFLLTFPNSGWMMIYVFCALFIGLLVGTYLDYRRLKKYFQSVHDVMDSMDKKYLVPEMLNHNGSQELEAYDNILREMQDSMNEAVSGYRRKSEEYKEYIETWVHEIKIPIATSKMIMTNHKTDSIMGSGLDMEMERIENYVEQALFYARSAEVEKDYFIKPIDLNQTLSETILQKKKMLIAKRASVDIHDVEPEKEILSDNKWLSFIIGQTIDNSIKYAKDEESLKIEIFCKEVEYQLESHAEKKVELHIKDNGIGMKAAEVDRVFDKGFTGSNGRANKASTGIGLYLCKKLCKRLEHDIRLESVEGEGTTVIIVF